MPNRGELRKPHPNTSAGRPEQGPQSIPPVQGPYKEPSSRDGGTAGEETPTSCCGRYAGWRGYGGICHLLSFSTPPPPPPVPVVGSLERSVNILQAWPCKPLRSIRFHLNYTHPASQRAGGSAESESEVRAVLTNICDALFSPFVQSGKYLFRGLVYFSIYLPHNARMKDCGRKEIGQDWCAGSGSIRSEFKLFGTGSGMMCPLCGALTPA